MWGGGRARLLRRPQLQGLTLAAALILLGVLLGVLGRSRVSVAPLTLASVGVGVASLTTQHVDSAVIALLALAVVAALGTGEFLTRFVLARGRVAQVEVACSLAIGFVCALFVILLISAAWWPQRRVRWRQAQFWQCLGGFSAALCAIGSVIAISPLLGVPADAGGPMGLFAYAVNIVTLPLSLVCSQVSLRLDVRIWLFGHLAGSVSERAAGLAMRLTARGRADPHLRAHALARFRHVQADKIEFAKFASRERDASLHALATESSALGDVDAFISHSWYDDPVDKWNALQAWINEFRAAHGRAPRVWLDKWSVDQANVEEDLKCLPLFLAGCRRVIVLAGPSYLERRWCVVELWLYMQMGGKPRASDIFLLPGFERSQATNFHVEDTVCYNAMEGEHLLEAIEAAEGGSEHFDRHIQRLFRRRAGMRAPEGAPGEELGRRSSTIAKLSPTKLSTRALGAMGSAGGRMSSSASFYCGRSSGNSSHSGTQKARQSGRVVPSSGPITKAGNANTPTITISGIPQVVLITDPGPDPDDTKAILVLASQHVRKALVLRAVVCNGGGCAEDRAALARCLLNSVGAHNVPVGVGSPGVTSKPAPHEFRIDGFHTVNRSHLDQGDDLLRRVLRDSEPLSLRFICISSLRDMCDLIRQDEDAFVAAAERVSIQGGVEWSEATQEYVPDTSQNNTFDLEGARVVYGTCLRRGVPLRIVSRFAIPHIPMQLARSFADRAQSSPVMRYLADAQTLGLIALWQKVCAGTLPARCSKVWYFRTFCGVETDKDAEALTHLDKNDDIGPYLNGSVKPYDVVAVMAMLPSFEHIVEARGKVVNAGGAEHRFLLTEEDQVPAQAIMGLLRETYNHVLALSGAAQPIIGQLMPSVVSPSARERVRASALVERDHNGMVSPQAVVRFIRTSRAEAGRWVAAACTRAAILGVLALVLGALGFVVIWALVLVDVQSLVFLYAIHINLAWHLYLQAVLVLMAVVLPLILFASREEHGRRQLKMVCMGVSFAYVLACCEWAACIAGALIAIDRYGAGDPVSDAPLAYHRYELGVLAAIITLWGSMSICMATIWLPRWVLCCGGAAAWDDGTSRRRGSFLRDSAGETPGPGALVKHGKHNDMDREMEYAARVIVARMQRSVSMFLVLDSLLGIVQLAGQQAFGARRPHEQAFGYTRVVIEMAGGLACGLWPAFIRQGRLLVARAAGLAAGEKAWLAPLVDSLGPSWDAHNLEDTVASVAPETAHWALTLNAARRSTLARDLKEAALRDAPSHHSKWCAPYRPVARRRNSSLTVISRQLRSTLSAGSLARSGNAPRAARISPEDVSPGRRRRKRGAMNLSVDSSDDDNSTSDDSSFLSARGSAVDWYVVRAPDEDPDELAMALGGLAEAFEKQNGRPPLVWIDGLHAGDPNARPPPAALPARLAVCRRLVVLVGPNFAQSLWCAVQVFCWFRVGGKHADVDVLPVLPVRIKTGGEMRAATHEERAATGRRLIADVDTFHAMFASVGTADKDEEVRGLHNATRLLHADRVNESVSSLLPQLQKALAAALAVEINLSPAPAPATDSGESTPRAGDGDSSSCDADDLMAVPVVSTAPRGGMLALPESTLAPDPLAPVTSGERGDDSDLQVISA